jgi:hypothetical protein
MQLFIVKVLVVNLEISFILKFSLVFCYKILNLKESMKVIKSLL